MPKREDAIDQMSGVKQDVRKRMDIAIAAIVALCWEYRSPDFTFSGHLALQREVNKVLAQMSDGILSDSEKRAILALAEAELQDYEEDALEFAEGEVGGEDMIFRLDRHGDHIKDLIAGWIAVAAYAGLTKEKTIQNFWTFLGDVGASIEWRKAGLKTPRWGKGFQLDTLSAITVVGQDMINRAFQFARIKYFQAKGAIGYRTIRQSSYICPLCDEMTKKIWRLDEYVLPYHPRCVCKAVPVYEETSSAFPEREKEYKRLLADSDYNDVQFNQNNGGLKATHKNHNLDKNRGYYEAEVQNIGFRNGHSVILGKERHDIFEVKNIEGSWDGLRFEAAGAETGTSNNIRNALKHCASKPNTEIAVILLLSNPIEKEIEQGLKKFNGLKGTTQWADFEQIVFLHAGEIYKTIRRQ